MTCVTEIVVKTVNLFHASGLIYHKFLALLGETESEHGEIIYFTSVRWVSDESVVHWFFDMLK